MGLMLGRRVDSYDIASFPSPSPPPGLELGPAGAGVQEIIKPRPSDGKGKSKHEDQKKKSILAKRKSKASVTYQKLRPKNPGTDICRIVDRDESRRRGWR